MSPEQESTATDRTQQNISNYDNGLITPPSENVVNRTTEIFDVDNVDGFLALLESVEEPTDVFDLVDEQSDIDLLSSSFDDPNFTNFLLDLAGYDGSDLYNRVWAVVGKVNQKLAPFFVLFTPISPP